MKTLKGTQTEKNILSAFIGESQARNKYTFWASKAKNEGFVQISYAFAKEFSFFTPKYYLDGAPYTIEGDFLSHDYEILRDGISVAQIGKEWFSWGDSYVIDMKETEDELMMLSILIVIDCVLSSN